MSAGCLNFQSNERPPDSAGDGTASTHTTREADDTATATGRPVAHLTDHGAAVDGLTDDTEALRDAIEAATPNGFLKLPPGEILIGSEQTDAITLEARHRGLTIRGSGPDRTRLKMAPGHESVHRGILIASSVPTDSESINIEHLTLDGQGLEQDFNIGTGIVVEPNGGEGRRMVVRNCVIRDWAVNGLSLREPGTRIYGSSMLLNGRKQEAVTGRDGHGVAAGVGDNPNGENVIQGCLFRGNTGAGADNAGGNMTIRDCVITECGYGVKQNDTTGTQVIENTRITDLRTEPGIYNIPPDEVGGDLVLDTVLMEDLQWAGIDLPARGTLSGDRIVVKRTDLGSHQGAGVLVRDEGRELDIGEMSVHGTTGGTALRFERSTGSIERLVHGNNDEGLGETSDVEIGSLESGDALGISVPTAKQVGAKAILGPKNG